MAEVLALASGVAGLVTLLDSVLARTYRYVRQVKDCEKTVSTLLTLLQSMSGSLHVLHQRINVIGETETSSHCLKPQMFDECFSMLSNVKQKLSKYEKRNRPEKHKIRDGLQSLTWPFEKSSMLDLIDNLKRFNDLVNSAIMADTMFAVKEVFSVASQLGTEMKTIGQSLGIKLDRLESAELSKQQREVLKYFNSPKSTERHNTGMKMWHSGTCRWFTEGENLQKWLGGDFRHLWVSGRPGAGKTVLTSAIIQKAKSFVFEESKKQALAYFYCDYKDSESQHVNTIFKALAAQLALQDPQAMSMLENHYHNSCKTDSTHSSTVESSLASLLHSMASNFDRAFIIVDALDECKDTEIEVTSALSGLGNEERISILVLSRDEASIHQLLRPKFEQIELAAQNIDLTMYVHAQMERRSIEGRLIIEDIDVKDKIIDKLINGADGMFRWVACQMDYLCELSSDSEREDALEDLPPGLFATYDRILERLSTKPAVTQRLVQKTLQWLVLCKETLHIDALREILSIDEGQQKLNKRKFPTEAAILRHCGSLIRRSAYGSGLEPAHFTVVEYLSMTGLEHDRFKAFRISSTTDLAKACLIYLNLDDFADVLLIQDAKQRLQAFPFREHAASYWGDYAKDHLQDSCVKEMIGKFMLSNRQMYFLAWLHDFQFLHSLSSVTKDSELLGVSAIHCAAFLRMPMLVEWCLQAGQDVDKSSGLGTPVHCALLGIKGCFAEADRVKIRHDTLEVLKVLLRYHADERSGRSESGDTYVSCFEIVFKGYYDDSFPIRDCIDVLISMGLRIQRSDVTYDTAGRKFRNIGLLNQIRPSEVEESFRAEFIDIIRTKWDNDASLVVSELPEYFSTLEEPHARMRLAARFNLVSELNNVLSLNSININAADNETGNTALHLAAEYDALECVKALVAHGADVDILNNDRQCSLQRTVRNSHGNIAEILLPCSARRSYNDADIWCMAARDNNINLLGALRSSFHNENRKFCVDMMPSKNPIFAAATNGADAALLCLSLEPSLIDLLDINKCNVLHSCACYSVGVLEKLLLLGLDANQIGEQGRNPLHSLLEDYSTGSNSSTRRSTFDHSMSDLMSSVFETNRKVLMLVEHGCNVEHVDNEGNTPIHLYIAMCTGKSIFSYMHPRDTFDTDAVFRALTTDRTRCATNVKGNTFLDCFIRAADSIPGSTAIAMLRLLIKCSRPLCIKANAITGFLHRLTTHWTHHSWQEDESNVPDFLQLLVGESPQNSSDLNGLVGLRTVVWASQSRDKSLLDYLSTFDLGSEVADVDFKDVSELISKFLTIPEFLPILKKTATTLRTFYTEVLDQANAAGSLHIVCSAHSDAGPEFIDLLVDIGAQVDAKCKDGSTPLMLAAENGKIEHFRRLMHFGADIHATDVNGCNALVRAVECSQVDMVKFISTQYGVEHDWNIRMCLYPIKGHQWGVQNCSLLHAAADSPAIIALVLENAKSQDINVSAQGELTALHFAALFGNVNSINMLLEQGANINAGRMVEGTPLHLAARYNKYQVVKLLYEKGADIDKTDSQGSSASHEALYREHFEIFDFLSEQQALSSPYNQGLSPAAVAQSRKQFDLADQIRTKIEARGDNRTDHVGRQPAEIHSALFNAMQAGDLDLVKLLVDLDHYKDQARHPLCGCTPVIMALQYENPAFAETLIASGYDTGYRVYDDSLYRGYSALHLASSNDVHKNVLEILLSETDQYHQYPVHPLHVAAAFSNTKGLRILLNYYNEKPGFDINSIRIVKDELKQPWTFTESLQTSDHYCCGGVLHMAVLSRSIEAVQILVEDNADINLATYSELLTPLHLAAFTRNTAMVRWLMSNGANTEARTYDGETPLAIAVCMNSFDVVELLLKCGAETIRHDLQYKHLFALSQMSDVDGLLLLQGVPRDHLVEGREKFRPIFRSSKASLLMNTENILQKWSTTWSLAEVIRLESDRVLPCLLRWLSCTGLLPDVLNLQPSPLCMAVQRGNSRLLQTLLKYKPDVNCRGCDEGTALDVACKLERFEIAKLLVRNGAEYTSSCVQNPKIRQWLFVERWTDQKRITLHGAVREIKPWSGSKQVPVPITGHYKQGHGESLLKWLTRRKEMQEWFYGKVLHHGPGIEKPFARRYGN